MSYRELRNFTEIMRALGYPRLISIENFRTPNFELVADALYWLAQRYDPSMDFPEDIEEEYQRVAFLKNIGTFMLTKARIKLNIKKLYGADGFAVKELLKIATMLYKGTKIPIDEDDDYSGPDLGAAAKFHDFRTTRELAKEITERGAKLFDLLEQEWENRELRNMVISRNFETNEVENMVHKSIQQVRDECEQMEKSLHALEGDERNLEAKIEKKRTELERNTKRLKSLKSVRPAFMDEYEKLEDELRKVYETFIERFRNLEYLEHELDKYNRAEQEKIEENEMALKRMQKRLHEEELRIFKGETDMDNDEMGERSQGNLQESGGRGNRPSGIVDRGANGGESEDESSDLDSLGSEDDLSIDDDDDLIDDDDDDDDLIDDDDDDENDF